VAQARQETLSRDFLICFIAIRLVEGFCFWYWP
jgi:hypothetical protein